MRITHNMLTRNYLKRMDTNLNQLTRSNDKMSSGRAYNKGFEDVSAAGKALKNRKLIAVTERQLTSIRDAEGRAAAAEDGLRAVNSLLIRAEDRLVEGLNGTMSETDRAKIADEMERMRDEAFQIMNNQFSEKYLYGATGNATGTQPFTQDPDGSLRYNGYLVDGLEKNPLTGEISEYDKTTNTYSPIKWNGTNYIDIGYGYNLMADGTVDPNSGFKDSYSGVESFGFGRNADGTAKNAYSLLNDITKNLRLNNVEGLEKNLNALSDSMEFLLTSITEVGARGVTLQDTGSRLEAELIGLQEASNDLEGIDLSHEIIYNKTFERSWMVTLQQGSKILPQSIFDFLN